MLKMKLQSKANDLLRGRQLIFSQNQGQASRFSPESFRQFVEFAVAYGATHVSVGPLPFRYNSWVLPDNTDPYAAWSNSALSLFRVCPPPALQEWLPLAHAKEAQAVISAQLEIMRHYGLKAVSSSIEPHWLPNEVYQAHPRWMGAQCELGRIAMRPYFAPNIDDPEVLELYRSAMQEFCTLFPEVDQLSFLTNDSGAGLAWAPCLYPGMNGPVRYRKRDGGARIATWLTALQEGAAQAGVAMRLNISSSGLPTEWVVSARAKLVHGLFVCGGNELGEAWGVAGANMGGGLWDLSYPVLGLGDPAGFLGGLQHVYHNPDGAAGRASIGVHDGDLDLARQLLDNYLENPGQGLLQRTALTLRTAEQLTGNAESAEELVEVWDSVQRALHSIGQIRQKGFGNALPFCGVSMRWLVRPLVPEPEKLTPEETAHYRNFLFSIEPEKDNPDFGYVLGKHVFHGEGVMWMARWCLVEAIDTLTNARQRVESIAGRCTDPQQAARLSLYAARIGALTCLAANIKNTIMYQYALDTADQPQYGPNMMDYDDNMICDMRALNQRKIAREEFDNIAELVELIETHAEKLIDFADSEETESVFFLSPHIVDDLKRKLQIMLDHWQDYEQLYPTTKVYDFEPAVKQDAKPD